MSDLEGNFMALSFLVILTGTSYLDAVQERFFPQLQDDESKNCIWKQDGAPQSDPNLK